MAEIMTLIGLSGVHPIWLLVSTVFGYLFLNKGKASEKPAVAPTPAPTPDPAVDAAPTLGHGLLLNLIWTFLKNKVSPLTATTAVHEDTAIQALAAVIGKGTPAGDKLKASL